MTDTRPDLAAIKARGRWLAHGEWVAEYCAEQPDEPEPLFRVQPEANAATVARIHNDLLAEVERLRAAVNAIDDIDETRIADEIHSVMSSPTRTNYAPLIAADRVVDIFRAAVRAALTPDGES